jgi:hypothetical protein
MMGYGNGVAGYYHMGYCSPKCSLIPGYCTGRTASDCSVCTTHAAKNTDGVCVCEDYWSGPDCSVRAEYATCAEVCSGCRGPLASDCTSCVPHATLNLSGHCVCDSSWTGDDCS